MQIKLDTLLAERDFLARFARSLIRDSHAAEDLVQETWLAALKNPPRAASRSWLTRVSRNLANSRHRREERRRRREAATVASAAPSTADEAATLEWHRKVVDTLDRLDEPYRTTLLLRFYEDLPPRAIAKRMDVTPGAVRTRLHRGLELMRARLDERADGDRRAWVVALAPLAFSTGSSAAVIVATVTGAVAVVVVLFALMNSSSRASRTVTTRDVDSAAPRVAVDDATEASEPALAQEAEAFETVRYRLVFDDGEPAAGLEVKLLSSKFVGRTSKTGHVRLPPLFPQGRGVLLHRDLKKHVFRLGYLKPGERELVIERGAPVRGEVRDARTQAPVVDARVSIDRHGGWHYTTQAASSAMQTGPDGKFDFPYVPLASHSLMITAEGYGTHFEYFILKGPRGERIYSLRPPRKVAVRVENVTGAWKKRSFRLGVTAWEEKGYSQDNKLRPGDPFEVVVPPPGDYRLELRYPSQSPERGLVLLATAHWRVRADEEPDPPVLAIPEGHVVKGTLRLGGKPYTDRRGGMTGELLRFLVPDGKGRYGLEFALAGTYEVRLFAGTGFRIGTIAVPGRTDLDLKGSGVVRGRIRDASPSVYDNPVEVWRKHPREKVALVYHLGRQGFRAEYLPPGDYLLVTPDTRAHPFTLGVGETVDVGELRVEKPFRSRVIVRAAPRSELPEAIWVRRPLGDERGKTLVQLDRRGRGLLMWWPGRHTVSVEAPGCEPFEADIEVRRHASVPIVIQLK